MASDKLRKLMSQEGEQMPMDMSSMIDLVFLLLIFFMVASHIITTQIDRRVEPPVAANAVVPKNGEGRVVINVLKDGSVFDVDKNELPTPEAITEYVEANRIRYEESDIQTKLFLHSDKQVDTRAIKRVIKAAGEAGVSEVIFGSYVVDKKG
jgi:biopolymer transport protein ExbD